MTMTIMTITIRMIITLMRGFLVDNGRTYHRPHNFESSAQLTLAVQDIDIDDSDSSGYIDIDILISTYTFTSTDSLPLSNSNYNASQS